MGKPARKPTPSDAARHHRSAGRKTGGGLIRPLDTTEDPMPFADWARQLGGGRAAAGSQQIWGELDLCQEA